MRYESASGEVRRHRHAQHRDRRDAVQHDDRDQLHEEVRGLRRGPDPARSCFDVQPDATSAHWNAYCGAFAMTMVEQVLWTALPNGIDRGRAPAPLGPRRPAPAQRRRQRHGAQARRVPDLRALAGAPQRAALRGRLRRRPVRGRRAGGATPTRTSGRACSRRRRGSGRTSFQDHAKRDLHAMPVRAAAAVPRAAYGEAGRERHRATVARRSARAAGAVPAAGRHPEPGHRLELVLRASCARAQQPDEGASPTARSSASTWSLERRPAPGGGRTPSSRPTASTTARAASGPTCPADYDRALAEATRLRVPRGPRRALADFPGLLRRLGIVIDLVVEVDARGRCRAAGVVRVIPRGDDFPRSRRPVPGRGTTSTGRWFGARPQSAFRMARGLAPPAARGLRPVPGRRRRGGAEGGRLRRDRSPHARTGPPHRGQGRARPGCPPCARPGSRSRGIEPGRRAARGPQGPPRPQRRRSRRHGHRTSAPRTSCAAIASTCSTRTRRAAPAGSRCIAAWSSTTFKPADGGTPLDPFEVTDEGYLKATTASSETKEHPTPSDDLYLHETICGWEGWSLAAPRPGQADRRARRGRRREQHRAPRPGDGQSVPARERGPGGARDAAEAAGRSHVPRPSAHGRPRRQQRAVHRARARAAGPGPCLGAAALPAASSRCRRRRSCAATSTPRASRSSTS